MIYLDNFIFPNEDQEFNFFMSIQRKCYNSFYPYQVLTKKGLTRIDCDPITVLYGGNGSGKTTALNVIAEKLGLERESNFNKSSFFQQYVDSCEYEIRSEVQHGSRIITSDDVFDYMLNLRALMMELT